MTIEIVMVLMAFWIKPTVPSLGTSTNVTLSR